MDYETVRDFSANYGLYYFMAIFAIVVVYALWPSNKKSFEDAASIPFKDEGPFTEDDK